MAHQRSFAEPTPHSSSAFTLVEMLVALLVLGVVLTATAVSLIAFTRQALADERRFQATGLAIEILEEFQALPWDGISVAPRELMGDDPGATEPANDLLGLALDHERHLGGDIDLLALEGLDLAGGVPPDGEVTFVGPDGLSSEVVLGLPEALSEGVMPAYERVTDRQDGREYDVYRIVTWVDRPGVEPSAGPIRGIKRLTTVVRWEILSRRYEEVFVAERAPDVREAGAFGLPQLIQYNLLPNPGQVCGSVGPDDYAVLPTRGFDVAVRLSRPVHAVRIVLPVIGDLDVVSGSADSIFEVAAEDLTPEVLPLLDEVVPDIYFLGRDLGANLWLPVGRLPVTIEVEEVLGGGFEAVATRTLEIRPPPPSAVDAEGDGCGQNPVQLGPIGQDTEQPQPAPVEIGAIDVTSGAHLNPATVSLYRTGGGSGKVDLCSALSIRVRVNDLVGGEVVNLVFVADGAPQLRTMSAEPPPPVGGELTGSSEFVLSFAAGSDPGFRGGQDATTFDVRVERGGDVVGFETGPVVGFTEVDKKQSCPS